MLPDFTFNDTFIIGDLQRIVKILLNDKKPLTVVQRKDTIDLLEDYEYNRNVYMDIRKRDDALAENDIDRLEKALEDKDSIILSQAQEISTLRVSAKFFNRFDATESDHIWKDYNNEIKALERNGNAKEL
ncbi:MAG: hypothetical protein JHC33_06660 [Ignisphaera sp.]|nr:hypothetical protein [Ignisphaera sp.]